MDQKSIGLCPQGFESPCCRMFGCNAVLFGREKEERAVGQSPAATALFLGLCHGACSVAATYKPPCLCPLPAGAYALQQYEKECVRKENLPPFGSTRHWWGGKSGAKGRLEMAEVSIRRRVLCRHRTALLMHLVASGGHLVAVRSKMPHMGITVSSRDSSRSEGPRFNPGSRQIFHRGAKEQTIL